MSLILPPIPDKNGERRRYCQPVFDDMHPVRFCPNQPFNPLPGLATAKFRAAIC